jgi:hypothetical protein
MTPLKRSDRPRARYRVVMPAAAAAALLLAGCSSNDGVSAGGDSSTTVEGANPQNSGQGGPGRGTFGTIAGIDGSTITVNSMGFDGTSQLVTVSTSADTKVTETKSGAVGDIKTGDNVTVLGTADGSEVAAQQITDTGTDAPAGGGGPGGSFPGGPNGPRGSFPGGGRPGGSIPNGGPNGDPNGAPDGAPNGGPPAGFTPTRGVVTSIDGTTLTVTPSDGSAVVTVTTSSSTTVSLRLPSSIAALAAGQTVQVQGQTDANGTVVATSINQGGAGFGPGGPNGGRGINGAGGPPPSR